MSSRKAIIILLLLRHFEGPKEDGGGTFTGQLN
jgi:hypothetical protein